MTTQDKIAVAAQQKDFRPEADRILAAHKNNYAKLAALAKLVVQHGNFDCTPTHAMSLAGITPAKRHAKAKRDIRVLRELLFFVPGEPHDWQTPQKQELVDILDYWYPYLRTTACVA